MKKIKNDRDYTSTYEIDHAQSLADDALGIVKFKNKTKNVTKDRWYSFYFTYQTTIDHKLVFRIIDDQCEEHCFVSNSNVEVQLKKIKREDIVKELNTKE